MLRTARNRMPTPKSCSEHCKEQLCHLIVRKFVYWLASICPSNTLDQFVVANFTSFRLTKSILLEMAVYKLQFKLVSTNEKWTAPGIGAPTSGENIHLKINFVRVTSSDEVRKGCDNCNYILYMQDVVDREILAGIMDACKISLFYFILNVL
jgi:hypothetical protein